ncbi:winged helix-turn-helix transcriptional regulator [Paenactinomyces guangxiensis]|uniref:Helix-turn-helix transcriptional regulator n=1 Tax=Paenactinomyces guangxiensis TaxID=1490290 RepID=A0A7W2A775_9BACL|nr:helix-turn-helix domain-containing protein [Paenactinomyces guangxiensis]MBA4492859.1 helix-turn-helix transcriptional regulator [Paenactinomyces guangxiensis]MBH8590292.1 helix-turn-helix transcriptional regulator [Paenactinomyces guangxiensis]
MTKSISERLQFLEKEGIVHSKLYSSHPPRYEYLLTGRGQELRHVLNAMAIWGNRFLEPKYTKLIHAECGYEVEPAYYCPHCESYVKNIAYDSDHTSE